MIIRVVLHFIIRYLCECRVGFQYCSSYCRVSLLLAPEDRLFFVTAHCGARKRMIFERSVFTHALCCSQRSPRPSLWTGAAERAMTIMYDPMGLQLSFLFCRRGTIFPLVFSDPMFWLLLLVHVLILRWEHNLLEAGEPGLPELPWNASSTALSLLVRPGADRNGALATPSRLISCCRAAHVSTRVLAWPGLRDALCNRLRRPAALATSDGTPPFRQAAASSRPQSRGCASIPCGVEGLSSQGRTA